MKTTFTGSNSYMLQRELRQLVDAFVAEYTDMGLEKLDGEEAEYSRIRESLESLPFLASKKMVVLRTPSSQKEFVENIEQLISNLPETTDVIIVEPKLDKRSVYYKTLKKLTDFHEYNEPDEQQLSRWLVDEAKAQNGTLNLADANFLVQRLGPNQQLLGSELEKLLQYDKAISRQTIELLTEPVPQSTIFDLLDAALNGRAKRALELYREQRAQKVEPIQIIALLGWQLHALAILKAAGERDLDTVASEAGLSPYVLRKSSSIASRLSMGELRDLIEQTHLLDVRLKSQSIDADEAMQNLLLTISK